MLYRGSVHVCITATLASGAKEDNLLTRYTGESSKRDRYLGAPLYELGSP